MVKVTLQSTYRWDTFKLQPEEQTWTPEYVIELPLEQVMKFLKIQTEYENMVQELQPKFDAAKELAKTNSERARLEREAKEAPEKEAEENGAVDTSNFAFVDSDAKP